jgi:hypothetical protein
MEVGMTPRRMVFGLILLALASRPASADDAIVPFVDLLARPVALKPELVGVHPRVFVTRAGLETLRQRARTTHREEWTRVLSSLPALKGDPPPPPGPQARRSQNDVAFAIAGISLAYQVQRKPEYLQAAKRWTLAAIDYEPWGYTYNKPNVDLAAGHLLYAVGWAYDLLFDELSPQERDRIRASLERHAGLVYDHFAPAPNKRFHFTQNHDFIPTVGLGVAALALLGEAKDAQRWVALARAHHERAATLLSPDGYYYEGFEYWIFSTPWLVHFLDAWEHATGESLWDRDLFRNWKLYVAHSMLPDGQTVFDFGDIWEGSLTRDRTSPDYARVYPGGALRSNFNLLYRVAARLRDPLTQAVAERLAGFGHGNLEEYWTLLWRDPELKPAPIEGLPLRHHFTDSDVVVCRSSWGPDAVAFAFKAGPPEGHRVAALLPRVPEWTLDSGHAHPDAGSFILWAEGRYLTGDTGYAGLPAARNHNTITVGGLGQGVEDQHDVWRGLPYASLDAIRIVEADLKGGGARIVADLAAAYPPAAGLLGFTRTFSYDGALSFTVTDRIETRKPRAVSWHLQSDTPFEKRGAAFVNGSGSPPYLEVALASPSSARAETGRAFVKSPGPPGSLETGPEEKRGYQLVFTTAEPVREVGFEVRLRVHPAPRP